MNNIIEDSDLKRIKICGAILKEVLNYVASKTIPGINTYELDKIAEDELRKKGATPSFKNYFVKGVGKYPASLCVSINNEVVHGLPKKEKVIKEGDIVSLDLGAEYQGLYTDKAITIVAGETDARSKHLIEITKKCLDEAIKVTLAGNRIGIIGETVQEIAEKSNFGVIRALVGHGIGKKPHLDPQVPNFGNRNEGITIKEGMALAIEPMITLGDYDVKTADDGWTILTCDDSYSAHFEHTVVIINNKAQIIT